LPGPPGGFRSDRDEVELEFVNMHNSLKTSDETGRIQVVQGLKFSVAAGPAARLLLDGIHEPVRLPL
jgi:hypothetical protein